MKKIMKKNSINKFDILIFLIPIFVIGVLLVIMYPGILNFDSFNQFEQIKTMDFNSAHPFIHTFIEMIILKIFKLPVAISIIQIILFSFIWMRICKYNREDNNIKIKVIQVVITLIMSMNPLVSTNIISLWKDTWYSIIMLLICFNFQKHTDLNFKCNTKNIIYMAFLLLFLKNIRHNGIVVLLGIAIIYTIVLFKKDRKSYNYIKFVIALLLFSFLFKIPMHIYDVKNKDITGNSAIQLKLLQMTSSLMHDNVLTKQELNELSKYVNNKKLYEAYNPYFIDNINYVDINHNKIDSNPLKFYKYMCNIAIKNYKNTIKFFLKNTTIIWRIDRPVDSFGTYIYTNINVQNQDPAIYHINENTKIYKSTINMFEKTMNNPLLIIILYSPALFMYLSIIISIILSKKHGKKMYLIYLPNMLNILGLCLSIPIQDTRYLLSNIILLYFMIIALYKYKNGIDNEIPIKECKKMTKSSKKILLIIPAYNEEENILNVYNDIINYNKKNKVQYDVIVINDGSVDNTRVILENNKIPHINLVNNLGIGGAVQTGYKYALENDYDIAIQFDGDGQHDVNYVKTICKPIIDGKASMVIGSRFIDDTTSDFKSSKSRRIGINIISKVIKFKTNIKVYDTTSGFRAVNREIIELFSQKYPVEYPEPISTVEVLSNKYKVAEVPVKMKEREGGVSSITSWKTIYYMFNVIISMLIVERRGK